MFLYKLWSKGFRTTVFIVVTAIVLIILVNLTQPLEVVLALFIPQKYIFWGLPFLIALFVLPPIIGLVTNGIIGNFIGRLVKRVPLLNVIFRKEETITESSIPAALEIDLLGTKAYIYGFVTGTTINQKTGKKLVSMLLPSIPVMFTAVISLDVSIENVKEVEIVDNKGRKQATAAIIQKKCLSFGQPLGSKVRFKSLKGKCIEKSLKQED